MSNATRSQRPPKHVDEYWSTDIVGSRKRTTTTQTFTDRFFPEAAIKDVPMDDKIVVKKKSVPKKTTKGSTTTKSKSSDAKVTKTTSKKATVKKTTVKGKTSTTAKKTTGTKSNKVTKKATPTKKATSTKKATPTKKATTVAKSKSAGTTGTKKSPAKKSTTALKKSTGKVSTAKSVKKSPSKKTATSAKATVKKKSTPTKATTTKKPTVKKSTTIKLNGIAKKIPLKAKVALKKTTKAKATTKGSKIASTAKKSTTKSPVKKKATGAKGKTSIKKTSAATTAMKALQKLVSSSKSKSTKKTPATTAKKSTAKSGKVTVKKPTKKPTPKKKTTTTTKKTPLKKTGTSTSKKSTAKKTLATKSTLEKKSTSTKKSPKKASSSTAASKGKKTTVTKGAVAKTKLSVKVKAQLTKLSKSVKKAVQTSKGKKTAAKNATPSKNKKRRLCPFDDDIADSSDLNEHESDYGDSDYTSEGEDDVYDQGVPHDDSFMGIVRTRSSINQNNNDGYALNNDSYINNNTMNDVPSKPSNLTKTTSVQHIPKRTRRSYYNDDDSDSDVVLVDYIPIQNVINKDLNHLTTRSSRRSSINITNPINNTITNTTNNTTSTRNINKTVSATTTTLATPPSKSLAPTSTNNILSNNTNKTTTQNLSNTNTFNTTTTPRISSNNTGHTTPVKKTQSNTLNRQTTPLTHHNTTVLQYQNSLKSTPSTSLSSSSSSSSSRVNLLPSEVYHAKIIQSHAHNTKTVNGFTSMNYDELHTNDINNNTTLMTDTDKSNNSKVILTSKWSIEPKYFRYSTFLHPLSLIQLPMGDQGELLYPPTQLIDNIRYKMSNGKIIQGEYIDDCLDNDQNVQEQKNQNNQNNQNNLENNNQDEKVTINMLATSYSAYVSILPKNVYSLLDKDELTIHRDNVVEQYPRVKESEIFLLEPFLWYELITLVDLTSKKIRSLSGYVENDDVVQEFPQKMTQHEIETFWPSIMQETQQRTTQMLQNSSLLRSYADVDVRNDGYYDDSVVDNNNINNNDISHTLLFDPTYPLYHSNKTCLPGFSDNIAIDDERLTRVPHPEGFNPKSVGSNAHIVAEFINNHSEDAFRYAYEYALYISEYIQSILNINHNDQEQYDNNNNNNNDTTQTSSCRHIFDQNRPILPQFFEFLPFYEYYNYRSFFPSNHWLDVQFNLFQNDYSSLNQAITQRTRRFASNNTTIVSNNLVGNNNPLVKNESITNTNTTHIPTRTLSSSSSISNNKNNQNNVVNAGNNDSTPARTSSYSSSMSRRSKPTPNGLSNSTTDGNDINNTNSNNDVNTMSDINSKNASNSGVINKNDDVIDKNNQDDINNDDTTTATSTDDEDNTPMEVSNTQTRTIRTRQQRNSRNLQGDDLDSSTEEELFSTRTATLPRKTSRTGIQQFDGNDGIGDIHKASSKKIGKESNKKSQRSGNSDTTSKNNKQNQVQTTVDNRICIDLPRVMVKFVKLTEPQRDGFMHDIRLFEYYHPVLKTIALTMTNLVRKSSRRISLWSSIDDQFDSNFNESTTNHHNNRYIGQKDPFIHHNINNKNHNNNYNSNLTNDGGFMTDSQSNFENGGGFGEGFEHPYMSHNNSHNNSNTNTTASNNNNHNNYQTDLNEGFSQKNNNPNQSLQTPVKSDKGGIRQLNHANNQNGSFTGDADGINTQTISSSLNTDIQTQPISMLMMNDDDIGQSQSILLSTQTLSPTKPINVDQQTQTLHTTLSDTFGVKDSLDMNCNESLTTFRDNGSNNNSNITRNATTPSNITNTHLLQPQNLTLNNSLFNEICQDINQLNCINFDHNISTKKIKRVKKSSKKIDDDSDGSDMSDDYTDDGSDSDDDNNCDDDDDLWHDLNGFTYSDALSYLHTLPNDSLIIYLSNAKKYQLDNGRVGGDDVDLVIGSTQNTHVFKKKPTRTPSSTKKPLNRNQNATQSRFARGGVRNYSLSQPNTTNRNVKTRAGKKQFAHHADNDDTNGDSQSNSDDYNDYSDDTNDYNSSNKNGKKRQSILGLYVSSNLLDDDDDDEFGDYDNNNNNNNNDNCSNDINQKNCKNSNSMIDDDSMVDMSDGNQHNMMNKHANLKLIHKQQHHHHHQKQQEQLVHENNHNKAQGYHVINDKGHISNPQTIDFSSQTTPNNSINYNVNVPSSPSILRARHVIENDQVDQVVTTIELATNLVTTLISQNLSQEYDNNLNSQCGGVGDDNDDDNNNNNNNLGSQSQGLDTMLSSPLKRNPTISTTPSKSSLRPSLSTQLQQRNSVLTEMYKNNNSEQLSQLIQSQQSQQGDKNDSTLVEDQDDGIDPTALLSQNNFENFEKQHGNNNDRKQHTDHENKQHGNNNNDNKQYANNDTKHLNSVDDLKFDLGNENDVVGIDIALPVANLTKDDEYDIEFESYDRSHNENNNDNNDNNDNNNNLTISSTNNTFDDSTISTLPIETTMNDYDNEIAADMNTTTTTTTTTTTQLLTSPMTASAPSKLTQQYTFTTPSTTNNNTTTTVYNDNVVTTTNTTSITPNQLSTLVPTSPFASITPMNSTTNAKSSSLSSSTARYSNGSNHNNNTTTISNNNNNNNNTSQNTLPLTSLTIATSGIRSPMSPLSPNQGHYRIGGASIGSLAPRANNTTTLLSPMGVGGSNQSKNQKSNSSSRGSLTGNKPIGATALVSTSGPGGVHRQQLMPGLLVPARSGPKFVTNSTNNNNNNNIHQNNNNNNQNYNNASHNSTGSTTPTTTTPIASLTNNNSSDNTAANTTTTNTTSTHK